MIALGASDLRLSFGAVAAVRGVSLDVHGQERLGIIGRSGSGKTGLARLLAGLPPPAATVAGRLQWPEGDLDLADLTPGRRRRVLGARLAWLPQEAHAALHPLLRLGAQVAETLRAAGRPAGGAAVAASLAAAGLDPALAGRYPHQVSGGQAQRAALACCLAQSPRVLIADEPTSALDAETGSAILGLLSGLARDHGMALVLVTHDLDAAARHCDRLLVLDAGQVVESGPPATILSHPGSAAAASLADAARRLARPQASPPCSAPVA